MSKPSVSIFEYNDYTFVYVTWDEYEQIDFCFRGINEAKQWVEQNSYTDFVYHDKIDDDFGPIGDLRGA